MMNLRPKLTAGFTLIELLVVIAIIGLLASIVIVSISGTRGKAKDTRVIADIRALGKQIELDFNRDYSTSFTAPNTLSTSGIYGQFINSIQADGGQLTVVTAGTPVTQYALYGRLNSDPTKYACVDSNGGYSAAAPGANSITCANANAALACTVSPAAVPSLACSGYTGANFATFTASGGTAPYSWYTPGGQVITTNGGVDWPHINYQFDTGQPANPNIGAATLQLDFYYGSCNGYPTYAPTLRDNTGASVTCPAVSRQ